MHSCRRAPVHKAPALFFLTVVSLLLFVLTVPVGAEEPTAGQTVGRFLREQFGGFWRGASGQVSAVTNEEDLAFEREREQVADENARVWSALAQEAGANPYCYQPEKSYDAMADECLIALKRYLDDVEEMTRIGMRQLESDQRDLTMAMRQRGLDQR